jgi:hypothetical protein
VLTQTPLWVYALFAFLLWQGVRQLRPRVRPLRRIALVPFVFVVWGVVGVLGRRLPAGTLALLWLGGAVPGALLGRATGPRLLAVDPGRALVSLPGSRASLVRNMVFFGLHYGLAVAAALVGPWRAGLIRADVAVSGASAGYFLAWGALLLLRYRRAPETTLTRTGAAAPALTSGTAAPRPSD